jgi:polar amino acid transport system permease protein
VNNQLLTKPFQVFAIVAISYYLICFSLTWLANKLEERIARKRRNVTPDAVQTAQVLLLTKTD